MFKNYYAKFRWILGIKIFYKKDFNQTYTIVDKRGVPYPFPVGAIGEAIENGAKRPF